MAFDPNTYLQEDKFDPNSYLKASGTTPAFDPEAYLKVQPEIGQPSISAPPQPKIAPLETSSMSYESALLPPSEMGKGETAAAVNSLNTVQEGVKKLGNFGGWLTSALFHTAVDPALSPETAKTYLPYLWDQVKKSGEAAPLDEVSNIIQLALLGYGGYHAIKNFPDLENLISMRTGTSKELVPVSEETMADFYAKAPTYQQEAMRQSARTNPTLANAINRVHGAGAFAEEPPISPEPFGAAPTTGPEPFPVSPVPPPISTPQIAPENLPSEPYSVALRDKFGETAQFMVPGSGPEIGTERLAVIAKKLAETFNLTPQALIDSMTGASAAYNQSLEAGMAPEQALSIAQSEFWKALPVQSIVAKLGIQNPQVASFYVNALKSGDPEAGKMLFQSLVAQDPEIAQLFPPPVPPPPAEPYLPAAGPGPGAAFAPPLPAIEATAEPLPMAISEPVKTQIQAGPETPLKPKTPKRSRGPETFSQFVRSQGGVNPELTNSSDILELGDKSLINRKSGKSLDIIRESAAEGGWIPRDTTSQEVIDLLKVDQFKPQYHPETEPYFGIPVEDMTLNMVEDELTKFNAKLSQGKLLKADQNALSELISRRQEFLDMKREQEQYRFTQTPPAEMPSKPLQPKADQATDVLGGFNSIQEAGISELPFSIEGEWPPEAGAVKLGGAEPKPESVPMMRMKLTAIRNQLGISEADWNKLKEKAVGTSYLLDMKPEELKSVLDVLRNLQSKNYTLSTYFATGKYIDNSLLNFNIFDVTTKKGISKTGTDIRTEYSGAMNAQKAKIQYLREDIKKIVPDLIQRQGLTLYRDSKETADLLSKKREDILLDALNSKNPIIEKFKPAIQTALNPTPEMLKADKMLTEYYGETGQIGREHGFMSNLIDDERYINRIWKPRLPDTFVKTETQRPGLAKTTGHAKERYYQTLFDGMEHGREPATLDSADLVGIHGEEFARVLANNKTYEALEKTGLGFKVDAGKPVPPGYRRLGMSNFVVPEWLESGLRAITDPNYLKRIEFLRNLQKYQGLVKTIDLSLSLFHHFSLAMNLVNQTHYGLSLPSLALFANSADWREIEQDFHRHGGMTATLDANFDVMREMSEGNDLMAKALKLPVIKQAFHVLDVNNKFLFGKMQPWFKVMDYGKKVSNWLRKHPEATDEETINAKRGFAREVNSAYGGLNWKALGISPMALGIARLLLLAPDWTGSNVQLFKMAAEGGTAGQAARGHIISGLIGGLILTEIFNRMITGRSSTKNAKGHEFEIEIRPNVYIPLFRGSLGDALKLVNMVRESGGVAGVGRFLGGKASPLVRTGIMLATGRNYYGGDIYGKKRDSFLVKTGKAALEVGQTMAPVPFGVSALLHKNYKFDPISDLILLSGLGRTGALPKTGKPTLFPHSRQGSALFKSRI